MYITFTVELNTDTEMKKLLLLVLTCFAISCSTVKKPSAYYLKEDELFNTRKYIGDFIDYSHTGPEIFGGAHLIWIRTTLYNSYGKLSAYGNKCDFSVGDKLYLKRLFSAPGNAGNWVYQIENDSSVYYRMSEYRYENNALVQAWF
jgi:hypothetical protein